jgi:hypothetical protein
VKKVVEKVELMAESLGLVLVGQKAEPMVLKKAALMVAWTVVQLVGQMVVYLVE